MAPSRHRSAVARSAIAAGFAFLLLAAKPAGAGDRFKYADGLANLRYFELATKEFEAMISDSKLSEEERAAGRLGLAKVKKLEAQFEPDALKRLEAFREAQKTFQDFIEKGRSHPRYLLAIFEYAELLQNKSELIAEIVDQEIEDVPIDRKALQEDANASIASAQENLKVVIGILEANPSRNPDEDLQLEKARFYQAINYFFLARVYERGTFEWSSNLKKSAEACENYVWDYEGRISAYYALLYKGKAHAELSTDGKNEREYDAARTCFDGVTSLAEAENMGAFQDVIEWSYLESAKLANAWERHTDAVAKVKGLLDLLKRKGNLPLQIRGLLAKLEMAKAYRGISDKNEAVTAAREVAEDGKNTYAGRLAQRLIRDLIGGSEGGPTGAAGIEDPKAFSAAADAAQAEGDRFAAIRNYQLALRLIPPGSGDKKLAATLFNKLGTVYQRMRRDYEAGLAFRHGATAFGDADKALYRDNLAAARSAFAAHYKRSKNPADKAEADQARKDYNTAFPEDADEFFDAEERYNDAGSSTNVAEAAKLYDEAKELYAKVNRGSRIDRARVRMGQCDFEKAVLLAKANKDKVDEKSKAAFLASVKTFDDYVAWTKERPAITETEAQERKQGLAAADYYRGRSCFEIGEFEKALPHLDGYAARHAGLDQLVPLGVYFSVRSLLELNRIDEADRDFQILRRDYAQSPQTVDAYARVGKAMSAAADALAKDAAQKERADAYLSKAAEYLYTWLTAGNRTFDQALAIAKNDFFDKGDYSTAEKILKRLHENYGDDPNVRGSERKWLNLRLLLARSYLLQQKYADAKPFYDELAAERTNVLDIQMERAECLGGNAILDAETNTVVVKDGTGDYGDALTIAIRVANSLRNADKMGSPEWWYAKWYGSYILFRQGKKKDAWGILENARTSGADATQLAKWRWDWLEKQVK